MMREQSSEDTHWMRRALRLATKGFTTPNPRVGCVIVRDGAVVGEGYHLAAGAPHAEAVALARAGHRAAGATAYVTLEPCAHQGRTPPCADALIAARVARVVACMEDPDPRVRGAGIDRLRRAGVNVRTGVLHDEAAAINAPFLHFHRTGRPHVTLKCAMSLDGKIATRTGDSKWITGLAARRYVHRERAQAGAVVCGVGTVLADDPMLTARFAGVPRQPLRVILDSLLRTPPTARVVESARDFPTLIAAGVEAPAAKEDALEARGVQIVRLPSDNYSGVSLNALLAELARRQVISLLVEGGGETHASFLSAGLADRLLWFVAPLIIGGRDARSPVEGLGATAVADAVRMSRLRVRRIRDDLLIECTPAAGRELNP